MLRLYLYARVQFCLRKSHARPRVQQAPGLPCALQARGQTKMQTSGAMRRENAKSYAGVIVREGGRSSIQRLRNCETSQKIATTKMTRRTGYRILPRKRNATL